MSCLSTLVSRRACKSSTLSTGPRGGGEDTFCDTSASRAPVLVPVCAPVPCTTTARQSPVSCEGALLYCGVVKFSRACVHVPGKEHVQTNERVTLAIKNRVDACGSAASAALFVRARTPYTSCMMMAKPIKKASASSTAERGRPAAERREGRRSRRRWRCVCVCVVWGWGGVGEGYPPL